MLHCPLSFSEVRESSEVLQKRRCFWCPRGHIAVFPGYPGTPEILWAESDCRVLEGYALSRAASFEAAVVVRVFFFFFLWEVAELEVSFSVQIDVGDGEKWKDRSKRTWKCKLLTCSRFYLEREQSFICTKLWVIYLCESNFKSLVDFSPSILCLKTYLCWY